MLVAALAMLVAALAMLATGAPDATGCRACLQVVNDIVQEVLPAFAHERSKRRRASDSGKVYQESARVGELDELLDAHLESGCRKLHYATDPSLKSACVSLLDTHAEDMSAALVKWHKANGEESELRSLLCARVAKACTPEQFGMVPEPGRGGKNKTDFLSLRPPVPNDGPVFIMVRGTPLAATRQPRPARPPPRPAHAPPRHIPTARPRAGGRDVQLDDQLRSQPAEGPARPVRQAAPR